MNRFVALLYGITAYAVFQGVFLYLVGFMINVGVTRSLDAPAEGSLWLALLVNVLLVTLFGVQHSVMARPGFKLWWTRFVPKPIERSTYVMFTNLALIVLFIFWRPMGGVIWDLQDPVARTVAYVLFGFGILSVLATTFLINHFDLFGLRQVWLYFRGEPYTHLKFRKPGPYRFVRHPLYVGWILSFWATPTMTVAHLLFALTMTLYILIAIPFEERDLVTFHGKDYEDYRRQVPKLIPAIGRKAGESVEPATKAPSGA